MDLIVRATTTELLSAIVSRNGLPAAHGYGERLAFVLCPPHGDLAPQYDPGTSLAKAVRPSG